MSTPVTNRCPKCGMLCAREPSAKKNILNSLERYRSPVIKCFNCNTTFFDDRYKEVAIDGVSEDNTNRQLTMSTLFCFIGIIIGSIAILAGVQAVGGLVLGFSFCLLVTAVIMGFYQKKKLAFLASESEERLSSPVYARLLKIHGYDIPDKYLIKNYTAEQLLALCDIELTIPENWTNETIMRKLNTIRPILAKGFDMWEEKNTIELLYGLTALGFTLEDANIMHMNYFESFKKPGKLIIRHKDGTTSIERAILDPKHESYCRFTEPYSGIFKITDRGFYSLRDGQWHYDADIERKYYDAQYDYEYLKFELDE